MMRQAGADVQALRPLRGRADARAWTPTPPYRAQRPPKKIQKKIWAQVPRGLTTRVPQISRAPRLVRWAAVEAVQRIPGHTRLGQIRDRIAARRGRNIGAVAAARELITLVFYGLRDHHIRCLPARTAAVSSPATRGRPQIVQVMTPGHRPSRPGVVARSD